MKINLTDWSSKKYGVRSRITIQKSSIPDLDLFKACIYGQIDNTGRDSTKGVFHSLGESTRSLKYYTNEELEGTYTLLKKVIDDYNKEILNKMTNCEVDKWLS